MVTIFKDPRFKRQLTAGILASIGRSIDDALFAHLPQYPKVLKQKLIAQAPRNGELLAVGAPLAVWAPRGARMLKTKKRDYAMGVSLYALPELVKLTGVNIVAAQTLGVGFSHRASAPYVTKAERLPFQTDFTY